MTYEVNGMAYPVIGTAKMKNGQGNMGAAGQTAGGKAFYPGERKSTGERSAGTSMAA